MTTHYLDEAERLCDRLAVVDAGAIVACDSPANFLASIGYEVLEVRVDDTERVVDVLREHGIDADDILVIGGTVTASPPRPSGAPERSQLLAEEHGSRSARPPPGSPTSTTSTSGSPAAASPSSSN